MATLVLEPRPVAGSVEELLARATSREPFGTPPDSKSGSPFERVVIDGEPFILKHVHVDRDWTMRFNGDIGCHPGQVWRAGLMDVLPDRIDHAVVAVADGLGRNGWGAAILMRDVSAALVPPGDEPLLVEQHLALLDTMAAISACTWGWSDDVGLLPLGSRWTWFNEASLAVEEAKGWPVDVPRIAFDGWQRFRERVPAPVLAVVDELRRDTSPLVERAQETPMCFVHGDWKLGNVGVAADGRTVLIDWTYPGEAPCCSELAWYLALNRARLPMTKEATIDAFRSSLGDHGIDTSGWFETQLALCLLGSLVIFGWEKALGDEAELRWWCDRALEGAAHL